MLESKRMYSVSQGEVWLSDLDSKTLLMRAHISRALELHGHQASEGTRSHSGVTIAVPDARDIREEQLREAHTEEYGYVGRIGKLDHKYDIMIPEPIQPGNLLEIPAIGWVRDEQRVVIGDYDGIYLCRAHSPNVETVSFDTEFPIRHRAYDRENTTLGELFERHEVIVKKSEWTGYPQTSIP